MKTSSLFRSKYLKIWKPIRTTDEQRKKASVGFVFSYAHKQWKQTFNVTGELSYRIISVLGKICASVYVQTRITNLVFEADHFPIYIAKFGHLTEKIHKTVIIKQRTEN